MKNKELYALIFLVGILFSCNSNTQEAQVDAVLKPVKYIKVGTNNSEGEHSYTGIAKAQQEAKLSFRVGGTVTKIFVRLGEQVKKGQVLAQLDASDYKVSYDQTVASVESSKAQIENAQAQLESAKSTYLNAKSNYNRFEKLYETNSISLSDFEQAKSNYLSTEASYKAAQTQIEAANASKRSSESMAQSASNQVSYTRLLAPFSGVITSLMAEENELTNQGNPIMVINSISNSNVEIGVPESTISEIEVNQKVRVAFNSISDKLFKGRVYEIGYSSSGSTYPVTIQLEENDDRIRPGMPASATFSHEKSKAEITNLMIVPPSAVGEDSDGNFVFLLVKDEAHYVCQKKKVEVGTLKDQGFEIKTGLSNGSMVASAGLSVLRNGMKVKLYNQ